MGLNYQQIWVIMLKRTSNFIVNISEEDAILFHLWLIDVDFWDTGDE